MLLLACVWRWAVRQGRSFHAALCLLCLVTMAVAVWSAFNIRGEMRDYLVFWVNSTGRRNTSMMRCCDAETETETVRPGGSACDAFAWSAAGNGACGAATVLEGDRAGAVE